MSTTSFFEEHPPFPEGLPLLGIPILSHSQLLAKDPSESNALWKTCTEHGFFLLRLDDADGNLLCEDVVKVYGLGRQFFDLPLATKQKRPMDKTSIGYKAEGLMKVEDGRPDLAEILAVSRDSVLANFSDIPEVFDREQALLKSLIERLHAIVQLIFYHLARHLDIKADHLDRFHQFGGSSGSQLRFVHNIPQTTAQLQTSMPAHADSGTITVLFNVLGGLQVLPAGLDDRAENWRWIKPEPGCAIVNIGDALVQWTGGVLRSAHHRVLYAPGAQSTCERYSFGYFLKPAEDAPMERFDEGNVIPKLPSQTDGQVGSYEHWQTERRKVLRKT